jgi:hypothetical protein
MSSSMLLLDPTLSSSPHSSSASCPPPNEPTSSTLTSPETTKFLYSSLHRVDNLLRQYHNLRTESNSDVSRMAHLSTRLNALASSSLAASINTIDYEHILCPFRLNLPDRMAIYLKEQLDQALAVVDATLTEMELVYVAVDDVLRALCNLMIAFRHEEVVKAANHVQQVYLGLFKEVGGIFRSIF